MKLKNRGAGDYGPKRFRIKSHDTESSEIKKDKNRKGRRGHIPEGKAGTTLVEMVVTLLIFSMMMTMAVGILSPAAKLFLRLQRLQYAQAVLDNTAQELRDMAAEATGYVKIYDSVSGGTVGKPGSGSGQALEFINPDGYIELISAEGCPGTEIYVGEQHIGDSDVKEGAIPPGRLFARYYAMKESDEAAREYEYWYQDKSGKPVARAVGKAFADGYYMGNYLELSFSFPDSADREGEEVPYLKAEIKLYDGEDKTRLMVQDTMTLELRYAAVRKDGVTAVAEPAGGG